MKRILIFIFAAVLALSGCGDHFISDAAYRATVQKDLESRTSVLEAAGVDFDAMGLDTEEREAMEFLYAYMPLGDIVNHSPEYYLEHYRLMRNALDEMPWGRNVPER